MREVWRGSKYLIVLTFVVLGFFWLDLEWVEVLGLGFVEGREEGDVLVSMKWFYLFIL